MDLITIRRNEDRTYGIQVRDEFVKCDMSVEDGGQGAGISPVELFAGSLGACVAMVVQNWCDACGYHGEVEVSLTLGLVPDPTRIGAVAIDVEVPETVPADRAAAVRRVVEHCVIKESLKTPPEIDVEIQLDNEPSPARVE